MRNTFAEYMTSIAQTRDEICLLSGDIGNRMFDRYKEIAPDRFINCGIAEANMMSMAAGMGLCGMRPVVYTITPFTTIRCLEQIRTGVAYHGSPVVIVGTGSGLSYAELGPTHHSLEDIAVVRCIPDMQVCAPVDSLELRAQLGQALSEEKPTYIRIGKKGEPDLFRSEEDLGIGKAQILERGRDILLIAAGPIVAEALEANRELEGENIKVTIATMGTIKPLDYSFLEKMRREKYRYWITLEEHYQRGGLGTAVGEWLLEEGNESVKLKRLGIEDNFIHELGKQSYVRKQQKIDKNAIKEMVRLIWQH